eukprot:tig00000912_g5433.t1
MQGAEAGPAGGPADPAAAAAMLSVFSEEAARDAALQQQQALAAAARARAAQEAAGKADEKDEEESGDEEKPEPEEMDLWHASGYGEFQRVKDLLAGGADIRGRDASGHTALHWACLNDHVELAKFLIENGAEVDPRSEDAEGQTPLHWACIKGHIGCVRLLVEAGADVHKVDNRGYIALTHAVQYGETKIAIYLFEQGTNLETTDREGHTALHWAAYMGHGRVVQWLLARKVEKNKLDDTGGAPIHYTASKGHFHAAVVLASEGADLTLKNSSGKLAEDIAHEAGHEQLAIYLRSQRKKAVFQKYIPDPEKKTRFFAGLFLFFSGLDVLVYFMRVLPVTSYMSWTHMSFLAVLCAMYFFYWKACRADPGTVTSNDPSQTAGPGMWSKSLTDPETGEPITAPPKCYTCNLVKPIRSKHCSVCDRCVHKFDHHCIWMNTCIGRDNHKLFFTFIILQTMAAFLVEYLFCSALAAHPRFPEQFSVGQWLKHAIAEQPLLAFCTFYTSLVLFGIFSLTYAQWQQAARNLTTNEAFNWQRYWYLRNDDGTYHNPFNQAHQ